MTANPRRWSERAKRCTASAAMKTRWRSIVSRSRRTNSRRRARASPSSDRTWACRFGSSGGTRRRRPRSSAPSPSRASWATRPGSGQALVSLGIINRARAEYQKAIDAYLESIAIRRTLGDRRGESQALGNLGNVYNELGEYQKAIDAHTRSLALAQEVGYTAQVGFSTHNLASVLAQLGRDVAAALRRGARRLAPDRSSSGDRPDAPRNRDAAVPRPRRRRRGARGARRSLDHRAARCGIGTPRGTSCSNLGSLELAGGQRRAALDRFEKGSRSHARTAHRIWSSNCWPSAVAPGCSPATPSRGSPIFAPASRS